MARKAEVALLSWIAGFALTFVASSPAKAPRLLMVSHSAGYQHEVVRRPSPHRLSLAEEVVGELARRSGAFEVSYLYSRGDLASLQRGSFEGFHGLLFFTTGSLPLSAEARQGLLELVRGGGGFVGVHSASDTWYDVPEYGELLGGYFDGHPWHERVRITVEDPSHASTRHLGGSFEITDEIYQFRNWSRAGARVLLNLDPRSVDVAKGKRPDRDYPLAWVRSHGRGRVFYTALGHSREVWEDQRFRLHLLGGIRWALGIP